MTVPQERPLPRDISDCVGSPASTPPLTSEVNKTNWELDQLHQLRLGHPDLFGSLDNSIFRQGRGRPLLGVLEDNPQLRALIEIRNKNARAPTHNTLWAPPIDGNSLPHLHTFTPGFLSNRLDVLFVDRCTEHTALIQPLEEFVRQLQSQNPALVCIKFAAGMIDTNTHRLEYTGAIKLSDIHELINQCVKIPTRESAQRTARWYFDSDYQRARRNDGSSNVTPNDLEWLGGFLSSTDIPKDLLAGITPNALRGLQPDVSANVIHILSMANVWHRETLFSKEDCLAERDNLLHRVNQMLNGDAC